MRVAIVGAGRMGQGIALALSRSGAPVRLLGRTTKSVPAPLTVETSGWAAACADANFLLVATPDAVIPTVADRLRDEGCVLARHVVLHLSGVLDADAFSSLRPTGAALGSFHPLQTVADPETAPMRLRGAYAGVEGDAAAVEAGRLLAGVLGMTAVRIPGGAKAAYHVGATLVANYSVALMGMAVRIAEAAGVPPEEAQRMYLPLLHGAAGNLDALGPVAALTGAIRRGDAGTVAAHLKALSGDDRKLYGVVGLEALEMARRGGLDQTAAEVLDRLLRDAATA